MFSLTSALKVFWESFVSEPLSGEGAYIISWNFEGRETSVPLSISYTVNYKLVFTAWLTSSDSMITLSKLFS